MPLVDIGRYAFRKVTVRSTVTPDMAFDPWAYEPGAPGPSVSDRILEFVRPSFYVETPSGEIPIEPYGPPNANYMPIFLGAAALVVGGVLYFAFKGLTAGRRR